MPYIECLGIWVSKLVFHAWASQNFGATCTWYLTIYILHILHYTTIHTPNITSLHLLRLIFHWFLVFPTGIWAFSLREIAVFAVIWASQVFIKASKVGVVASTKSNERTTTVWIYGVSWIFPTLRIGMSARMSKTIWSICFEGGVSLGRSGVSIGGVEIGGALELYIYILVYVYIHRENGRHWGGWPPLCSINCFRSQQFREASERSGPQMCGVCWEKVSFIVVSFHIMSMTLWNLLDLLRPTTSATKWVLIWRKRQTAPRLWMAAIQSMFCAVEAEMPDLPLQRALHSWLRAKLVPAPLPIAETTPFGGWEWRTALLDPCATGSPVRTAMPWSEVHLWQVHIYIYLFFMYIYIFIFAAYLIAILICIYIYMSLLSRIFLKILKVYTIFRLQVTHLSISGGGRVSIVGVRPPLQVLKVLPTKKICFLECQSWCLWFLVYDGWW